MEMIDVLTKLKEIAEKKPESVKDAVENVEKTNPKLDEGNFCLVFFELGACWYRNSWNS